MENSGRFTAIQANLFPIEKTMQQQQQQSDMVTEQVAALTRYQCREISKLGRYSHSPLVDSFKQKRPAKNILSSTSINLTRSNDESGSKKTDTLIITKFPEKAFLPKLQIADSRADDECPKAVLLEQRRRQYSSLPISRLIADAAIDTHLILPDIHAPGDPSAEAIPVPVPSSSVSPLPPLCLVDFDIPAIPEYIEEQEVEQVANNDTEAETRAQDDQKQTDISDKEQTVLQEISDISENEDFVYEDLSSSSSASEADEDSGGVGEEPESVSVPKNVDEEEGPQEGTAVDPIKDSQETKTDDHSAVPPSDEQHLETTPNSAEASAEGMHSFQHDMMMLSGIISQKPDPYFQYRIQTGKPFEDVFSVEAAGMGIHLSNPTCLNQNQLSGDAATDIWNENEKHRERLKKTFSRGNEEIMFQQFPLHWFDDAEFDERLPEEWMTTAFVDGVQHPVPAFAFLPIEQKSSSSSKTSCTASVSENGTWPPLDCLLKISLPSSGRECSWTPVAVLGYHRSRQLFLLRLIDQRTYHLLPRIHVMFVGEDPRRYSHRLLSAITRRQNMIERMRFQLCVENMPADFVSHLNDCQMAIMKNCLLSSVGIFPNNEKRTALVEKLLQFVHYEYVYHQNKSLLDSILKKDTRLQKFVVRPKDDPISAYISQKELSPSEKFNENSIEERVRILKTKFVLTHPEVINTLEMVNFECMMIGERSIFALTSARPLNINDYDQMQLVKKDECITFLKSIWLQRLKDHVCRYLGKIGRGWYDLKVNKWRVFRTSKLSKVLALIRTHMESTLRSLAKSSCTMLAHSIRRACKDFLLHEDFEWDENLRSHQFPRVTEAIFYIQLQCGPDGPCYSTDLDQFPKMLASVVNRGVAATHTIPPLEPLVLEHLFWPDRSCLSSMGIMNPVIDKPKQEMSTILEAMSIPVMKYADKYSDYCDQLGIEIDSYLEERYDETSTAQQFSDDIAAMKSDYENTTRKIPKSIDIGPFHVDVEKFRMDILNKKHKMIEGTLNLLAKRCAHQAIERNKNYQEMSSRLTAKCQKIEDLLDLQEYVGTVPVLLQNEQETTTKFINDYDVLENFNFNLSQNDFAAKWNMLYWPSKINKIILETFDRIEEETARFRERQLADQSALNDKIDSITMLVAGMSAYRDMSKVHEIASEVRRIWKSLKETNEMCKTLNQRQRQLQMELSFYDLSKLIKDAEPYTHLWITASDWIRWQDTWLHHPLQTIDAENIDTNVKDSFKLMNKALKYFEEMPHQLKIAEEIHDQIVKFKPFVPLIQALRTPGMRHRHWDKISDIVGVKVVPKSDLTFQKCLEMGLNTYTVQISELGELASKEYSIEQALDKMESDWRQFDLEVLPYKDTGHHILKLSDDVYQLLDDQIAMTQAMLFSPYKAVFEDRISAWQHKLMMVYSVFDQWVVCQRSWLYLEPIFSSDDIVSQLPLEAKRYKDMEKMWRKIMKSALETPEVMKLCPKQRFLSVLKNCTTTLEQVQKGLSDYLESKRLTFPRFFFLSDEELLEILSHTKNPETVQPHLKKCFESINELKFEAGSKITAMCSSDGEVVYFDESMYPSGNVEHWLLKVEQRMQASLREILGRALSCYEEKNRCQWVFQWPGQLVIAGCQSVWSANVDDAIRHGRLSDNFELQLTQLDDLRSVIKSDLTPLQRNILSALIVIEVHARDVVWDMVQESVSDVNEFSWISQLRYYWTEDNLLLHHVNARFKYGFEYLGNTGRLVITPLTDRCYLTLTGALHLKFGGAPAGPAGTGKTETTKDLGKAMAIQTVVFNCSDQLDFMAMGKFFKGLAAAGAWACFDEFNRIDIEVLSVVAQQISCIQKALINNAEKFWFEGVELNLKPSCAVFITMNPGYAGRTELPDNLSALFRPVAMMVPNYTLIAEISLFSFGFGNARNLANKITSTFKLSSEQLSTQGHYDFGMRAVKTVIATAGNLKRQYPDMNEELIVLRALKDVNVPKFLKQDLQLFSGIISDLFPHVEQQEIHHTDLEESLVHECHKRNLQPIPTFLTKCIQLYDTTVVRHGLMLVGPSGSGKTTCYQVLQSAITRIRGKPSSDGTPFTPVQCSVLNPKSITMGQLYGEFDATTHEWTDGILSTLIRAGCAAQSSDKKWYMFDGPVDAVWIENMNTVLDDNKKLCLSSGEIIKLDATQRMMFEVGDLAQASPATVSRCGMVYLEPSGLGLKPLIDSWIGSLPTVMKPFCITLKSLCSLWIESSIIHLRANAKVLVQAGDSNLCTTLFSLMSTFFQPLLKKRFSNERLAKMDKLINFWFFFSLTWSIGGVCSGEGRKIMDAFVRTEMKRNSVDVPFPSEGIIFDYRVDDGGLLNAEVSDDALGSIRWLHWMEGSLTSRIPVELSFTDIFVPTIDSIRNSFLIGRYLCNSFPVICIGGTGTSKTSTVSEKLIKDMPQLYINEFVTFSARTSANKTQDLIDSKLDRRGKGQYGPPPGKQLIIFIDDLNMPTPETYGAQPPLELVRQWADFHGWYDRKQIGLFRHLVDINFACAMGLPGGGRTSIPPRLLRHFCVIGFPEVESECMEQIYGSIMSSWLTQISDLTELCVPVVRSSISVYSSLAQYLLPTPSKSHYTFNLRDLSRVFQGIWMASAKHIDSRNGLVRLWYHEMCRVFKDRLVCEEDCSWLDELLRAKIDEHFQGAAKETLGSGDILFGDIANFSGGERPYCEVSNNEKLSELLQEYMKDYNQVCAPHVDVVFFEDAVRHLLRLCRVLRQPRGNALLLGMGGSGRQSLSRLAAFIVDAICLSIELTKHYSISEWKEDLKRILRKAGIDNEPIVFLFSDTQIKSEVFMEDLNNLLNSSDVPSLFASEELEEIYGAMRAPLQDEALPPTTTNLYALFIRRVQRNLRVAVTMSPIGEAFRERLRQFPALINCCTIDWFSDWPAEALQSVAFNQLSAAVPLRQSQLNALVKAFSHVHADIVVTNRCFQQELSRHNYITPKSFLTALNCFASLLELRKGSLCQARDRLKVGLEKLLQTGEDVAVLRQELESMQPELELAAKVTEETMKKIEEDAKVAEETRKMVQGKEQEAQAQASKAAEIAEDAQRGLDEALPALEAALASLKSLNKNDVTEVRAMQRPPEGVKLVMEAVCILKGIKPKKIPGNMPGQKLDDFWEPGKSLLSDPGKFITSLLEYDKNAIPEDIISKLTPYIENEAFRPQAVAKVSKACTSLCMWARAMHKYHFVNKSVAPKREALTEAEASLAVTQGVLDEAMAQLRGINEGLAELNAELQQCVDKRKELEDRSNLCQQRLARADKLIEGLAEEKQRWTNSVSEYNVLIESVVGDVVLSAAVVAYLGPFTDTYRQRLVTKWKTLLEEIGVPQTHDATLQSTLGDQITIRNWQLAGLPKDAYSIDNGLIMKFSDLWPMLIDPQEQANKWIKKLEKNNQLEVVRITEKDYLRKVENCIRFGKPCLLENMREEVDPALDPILLKRLVKQGGEWVIRLGDNVITYSQSFKLYMSTKMANPHFSPEVCTKVNVINFKLVKSGLQDQLMGVVAVEERPDLEETRNNLIISNAAMKTELKLLEDKLLYQLSTSKGSPVDDLDLIKTLDVSKEKAVEITEKMKVASETEEQINEIRSYYAPVAVRARVLFFCISNLPDVDPMYQYSLEWFLSILLGSIKSSEKSDNIKDRVHNIQEHFTFSIFCNVCRSLFEKHKLLLAFHMAIGIQAESKKINMEEYHFFLTGGSMPDEVPRNPHSNWLPEKAWKDIVALSYNLPEFKKLSHSFIGESETATGFKTILQSDNPYKEKFPGMWNYCDLFQRLVLVRCLRPDKLTGALQTFVGKCLGEKFVEPQTASLSELYATCSATTPLILVLSVGTDPADDLYKLAKQNHAPILAISLGQGQGPIAEEMLKQGMRTGEWVFFQNCHLSPSWMPSLEQLVEALTPDAVHPDFRLWLTSAPSSAFPLSVLQNGMKMTVEPPRGVKANLLKTYTNLIGPDTIKSLGEKAPTTKMLLLSLSFFHAVCLERRKFGPIGFNIPYAFSDGDLRMCISQLQMFMEEYDFVPFKVLRYTSGHINYGGRVTDDLDRRCILTLLNDFYREEVLDEGHAFDALGKYRQLPATSSHQQYVLHVRQLPLNDPVQLFGLHSNAAISCAQREASAGLAALLLLHPRESATQPESSSTSYSSSSSTSLSSPLAGVATEASLDTTTTNSAALTWDQQAELIAQQLLAKIPEDFDVEELSQRYPVMYEESMNTVLVQEAIRYNHLLAVVRQSLKDLLKALKGLMVMSNNLEDMANALVVSKVPRQWDAVAYPSLKPLAAWIDDLLQRLAFLSRWTKHGKPIVYWISGFFFPQAFMTGTLQNYARQQGVSIDTVSFGFQVLPGRKPEPRRPPDRGCYVQGLFLEGAGWDPAHGQLQEQSAGLLHLPLPVLWLRPELQHSSSHASNTTSSTPQPSTYSCPVYKTLSRAGTLSTTGHSTNYVLSVELPVPVTLPSAHWVKRGAALFCALDY